MFARESYGIVTWHMIDFHLLDSPYVDIIVSMWNNKLHLNESILRTRGARGISMNSEFVKNVILRRASRFVGTSIADSFTVRRRYSRLNYNQRRKGIIFKVISLTNIHV